MVIEFTVWFMKKVGFEWEEIDTNYIKGYIEYFERLGYINKNLLDSFSV